MASASVCQGTTAHGLWDWQTVWGFLVMSTVWDSKAWGYLISRCRNWASTSGQGTYSVDGSSWKACLQPCRCPSYRAVGLLSLPPDRNTQRYPQSGHQWQTSLFHPSQSHLWSQIPPFRLCLWIAGSLPACLLRTLQVLPRVPHLQATLAKESLSPCLASS